MHFGPSGKVGRLNVLFPITYCIPVPQAAIASYLKHVLIYALYS